MSDEQTVTVSYDDLFSLVIMQTIEIEKLRAALKGVIADMNRTQFPQTNVRAISVGALNAAADALKETDSE